MDTMNKQNIVAVCQMNCQVTKCRNMEIGSQLIREAKNNNAAMVFLPEAFDYICDTPECSQAQAETIDGFIISYYRRLAKSFGIWISLGGFHEKISDGQVKNTHVIINDQGEIIARYSKIHLFDFKSPTTNLEESKYIVPGQEITLPVQTPVGKVGMAICYDIRFPEISLILRNAGAEIITYPSAFTYETGAEHWETLLKSRAIETQSYVIAPAQSGNNNMNRNTWGHAMIVNPWGIVMAQCVEDNTIACANISLERLNFIREIMPLIKHRRNDIYPKLVFKKKPNRCENNNTKKTPNSTTQMNINSDDICEDPNKCIETLYLNLVNNNEVCTCPEEGNTFIYGNMRISQEIIFYQTDYTIAFTNIRCIVPGHVLVIPKDSVQKLSDLSQVQLFDLFSSVQKIEKIVTQEFKATSSIITIQNGEDAGQTIKHLHVHILPRKKGDFKNNDDIYEELENDKHNLRPFEEMKEEAEKLKLLFLCQKSSSTTN